MRHIAGACRSACEYASASVSVQAEKDSEQAYTIILLIGVKFLWHIDLGETIDRRAAEGQ